MLVMGSKGSVLLAPKMPETFRFRNELVPFAQNQFLRFLSLAAGLDPDFSSEMSVGACGLRDITSRNLTVR